MGQAVAVGLGVAWRWFLFYAVMCFVTQLWAGSQYSIGQGGGLLELVGWSAAFGVLTVAAVVERDLHGTRWIVPRTVFRAAVIGHILGAAAAVAWFTSKNGPSRGDWWIAPAAATLAVVLWVHLLTPRRARDLYANTER